MYGPSPRGHWSRHGSGNYESLHVGKRYRVSREFVDFDRVPHTVGEEWTFLGHNYLPYDAGLSLFVSLDDAQEWHIRMQDYPEEQQAIIDNFSTYLCEVEPGTG